MFLNFIDVQVNTDQILSLVNAKKQYFNEMKMLSPFGLKILITTAKCSKILYINYRVLPLITILLQIFTVLTITNI